MSPVNYPISMEDSANQLTKTPHLGLEYKSPKSQLIV